MLKALASTIESLSKHKGDINFKDSKEWAELLKDAKGDLSLEYVYPVKLNINKIL